MSRPPRPNWTVPIWAPDADYGASADPWSVTPTKVDHPGRGSVGFTPRAAVPAQCMNLLVSDAYASDQSAKDAVQGMHDWIGLQSVKNWFPGQTAISGPLQVRFWNGNYYVSGNSGGTTTSFCRTKDVGSWPTVDEIGATPDIGATDANFDVSTVDGSIVLPGSGATDGKSVVECTSAGVWTKRTALFVFFLVNPDCIFEPASQNWVVAGHRNGAGTADFYTSTNRTSWTPQTCPTFPADGSNGNNVTLAKDGLGKVVVQSFPSSIPAQTAVNSISFSMSSDGGVTWSTPDTHTTAFATSTSGSPGFSKPIWTGSTWVAVVSCNAAGNLRTYVYNSSDGATWTQVAVLTSLAINHIACDGDFVIGVSHLGDLVYSVDLGATWFNAFRGVGSAGSNRRLFGMNGGFAATDVSKVTCSLAMGGAGTVALT